MPRASRPDRIGLVAVQPQLFARVVRLLILPEDAGAFLVQDALRDQLVDGLARLEGGVELYEGVGPEQIPSSRLRSTCSLTRASLMRIKLPA